MRYDFEPLLDPSSKYLQLCEAINTTEQDVFADPSNKTKSLVEEAERRFTIEIEELDKKEEYYFACPYNIYEKTYQLRKDGFLEVFTDAKEIDFIGEELKKGISNIPYLYCDPKLRQKFTYSLGRRWEFLKNIAKDLGFSIEVYIKKHGPNYYEGSLIQDSWVEEDHKIVPLNKNKIKSIEYTGSQTQLIELVKALIENKSIKGTQKDIIKDFSEFFGIEVSNPDKLIQDIKKRNNGSEALFLDELRSSLIQFISK